MILTAWVGLDTPPTAQAADVRLLRAIIVPSQAEGERAIERIRKGEDFAAVARSESTDASASSGGLLGRIDISTMRPELREAVRSLRAGEISTLVQVPIGFAILKVESDSGISSQSTAVAPPAGLASTGSVKYVIDVGGLPEAETVLREYQKPVDWNQDPITICQTRRASLAAGRKPFDDFFSPQLEPIRRTRPPFELMQAHLGLAQLMAYVGDLESAMPHYQGAYQMARSGVPQAILQMQQTLGLAHLHKAEMDNDIYRAAGDLCLIPPRSGAAMKKTDDLDRAVQLFLEFLEKKPDDLEVRWALNLAVMMAGKYPDGIPARFLIPPSAFASREDVGRFVDVAPETGLNVFATAGGVIVDELAGDGRFDVMTSNFFSCGPLHYFANNGDGTYTERTAAAGLANQLGGLNIIQTDYDNDRCQDVLVLRGGWEVAQRKSLLKNNCNGTFTDVTVEVGLAKPATSSQTAVWTDINNDGLLDLFIGNEDSRAQLFLNKGGRFEDIASAAGVNRLTYAKGVASADYDNDGFADLYVSNYDGNNILYRNNHDNTFTDTTTRSGAVGPGRGFATWFFDYDNDGWMDLFATSYFMSIDETARTYLGLPHNAATLKLYHNQRNGTFRDVTSETGLLKVFMPMGANFGDLDNDGFLDIYMGMGNPSFGSMAPHVLLRNENGQRFVDVTTASGTGELHKGHGVAFVDLDNDGDQEIVAETGGATPADSHTMRVFENPGHDNDWVALKLVGTKSNRAGIGARIQLTVENEGQGRRSIHRMVTSGGSFGAAPLEQHVGIGKMARIVDVEVWWPTTNTRQRFTNIEKNQVFAITEFDPNPKRLEREKVRLGGKRREQ